MEWLAEVDACEIREFCLTRNDRFEDERAALRPFDPARAPDIRPLVDVVASREGYIRHETNKYSVPAVFIGKTLQLRVYPLSREADLLYGTSLIRSLRLENPGERAIMTLPEDRKSLFELWQKQNKPAKAREKTRSAAKKNVEVAIRPPLYYESFSTGEAS